MLRCHGKICSTLCMWLYFWSNIKPQLLNDIKRHDFDAFKAHFKTNHVHQRDAFGNSLLHLAILYNSHLIAHLLISTTNINLNLGNKSGFKALHFAVIKNQPQTCELLIKHQAKINTQSHTGITPFFLATLPHLITIAQLLIQHGADYLKPDYQGVTPLYMAAAYDNIYLIKVLFDLGVDPSAKANNGFEPICIAAYHLHFDVVSLIEKQFHQQRKNRLTYKKRPLQSLDDSPGIVPFEIETPPPKRIKPFSLFGSNDNNETTQSNQSSCLEHACEANNVH